MRWCNLCSFAAFDKTVIQRCSFYDYGSWDTIRRSVCSDGPGLENSTWSKNRRNILRAWIYYAGNNGDDEHHNDRYAFRSSRSMASSRSSRCYIWGIGFGAFAIL